jgi:hypothetical protein
MTSSPTYQPTFSLIFAAPFREVSEWSKEHAWKVCMGQKLIVGSNPILSALLRKPRFRPGNGAFALAVASLEDTYSAAAQAAWATEAAPTSPSQYGAGQK